MVEFTVDRGVKVSVSSRKNAAYKQSFTIERQLNSKPGWWEGMGKKTYFGNESANFVSFTELTTWKITCKYDWENENNWKDSREQFSGQGTSRMTISCDDTPSGDNDYDDLIVTIFLSANDGHYSKEIAANIDGAVAEEDGDGNFILHKEKIPIEVPDKGKNHVN